MRDHQTEAALLGIILRSGEYKAAAEILETADFDHPDHLRVFDICGKLSADGVEIDLVAVHAACPELTYFTGTLTAQQGTTGNLEHYARRIRELSMRRKLRRHAMWLAEAEGDVGAIVEAGHLGLDEISINYQCRIQGRSVEEELAEGFAAPEEPTVSTGFRYLDSLLDGGLRPGGYTLITGLTGDGKSTLMTQIALNLLARDQRCWLGSYEIPAFRTAKIMMMQAGLVPTGANVETFSKKITHGHLWVSGTTATLEPEKMAREIEFFLKTHGVKFFFIDNLSTLEAMESGERLEKQTRLMQRILRFSLEYRVHFLIAAHMRKAVQGRPTVTDISGAGQIGNFAENALLIQRKQPGALLSVLKTRAAGMGKAVRLNFDPHLRLYSESGGSDE